MEFYKILIPSVLAIIGWVASHQFAAWRDRENKRREFRLNYLIGAYRALSKANHHPDLPSIADEVEQAISDIQFLGTGEQIAAAQAFAIEMHETQKGKLDPLLDELKQELRHELGRKPYEGKRIWFRISRTRDPHSADQPFSIGKQRSKRGRR